MSTAPPRLRIGHGNGKNKQGLVDYIESTEWDSFGAAEADRLIGRLSTVDGARVHVIDQVGDRLQDTPVLVSDEHASLGAHYEVVSKALGKPGDDLRRVAPARVLTVALYAHPLATALGLKGIAHLNLHPDAGPKQLNGLNPRAPITREYRSAWRHTRAAWRAWRRAGYLVVLTSDAQMGPRSTRPWAPRIQARRLRARSWSTGIDWLIFDRRLRLDGQPRTHRLFDHPGFVASLVPIQRLWRKTRKA